MDGSLAGRMGRTLLSFVWSAWMLSYGQTGSDGNPQELNGLKSFGGEKPPKGHE
jgi:hypothetical protein